MPHCPLIPSLMALYFVHILQLRLTYQGEEDDLILQLSQL